MEILESRFTNNYVIVTLHQCSPDIDYVGGELYIAENESLTKYVTARNKSLFVQTKNFDYVIEAFKSVFPLKDAKEHEIQRCFDVVSYNIFDNKTCKVIVERMAKIKTKDSNVELFLRDLIKWLNTQLRYADDIVVFGNL